MRMKSFTAQAGYACRFDIAGSYGEERAYHIAWWSRGVVGNGWQPYDQPDSSAYLPLGFDAFTRVLMSDGSEVLVQRGIPRVSSRHLEELRREIGEVFAKAGAPPEAVEEAVWAIAASSRS